MFEVKKVLPTGEDLGGAGGAAAAANKIMWYATQAREAYPYYQHEAIGFNYRMSNVCAGIGIGQMTVAQQHIDHHKKVQRMYEELLADVPGIRVHAQPADAKFDSNYWLCTITLDENLKVKGQEMAYKKVIEGAVGGAAGVIHAVDCPTTDCQPNDNVEAMRMFLDAAQIEARPVWKPMHKQPVYSTGYEVAALTKETNSPSADDDKLYVMEGPQSCAYLNGVSEQIFKVGLCLPAGPCVTEDDVRYIVDCIKNAIA